MIRIIDGRGTGKTTKLLSYAQRTGATVVCGNPRAMIEKAHSYDIKGLEFISYGEYVANKSMRNKKYVIDEAEMLLNFINGECVGYSLTDED